MVTLTEQHDVLTADQRAYVIERFRSGLVRSMVHNTGGKVESRARTSSSVKISRGELRQDVDGALAAAIESGTGVSGDRVELWELVHYELGAYYKPHVDWLSEAKNPTAYHLGGQRTHSAILYLSDVEEGGETFFPLLKKSVLPRAGLLVTWNNLRGGKPLLQALHESRPVTAGEKWALVTWVRERPHVPTQGD